jgi:hypothetical protein
MLALVFENSFGYRVLGAVHLLAAIAAFGPLFLYPPLRRAGETATIAAMHMRFAFPALVLLWVAGMGLAGVAELDMSQLWLALSIVDWAVLMGVSWFLIRPSIDDRSDAASAKLSAGVGITHLGLIIGLVLMIWKPGS